MYFWISGLHRWTQIGSTSDTKIRGKRSRKYNIKSGYSSAFFILKSLFTYSVARPIARANVRNAIWYTSTSTLLYATVFKFIDFCSLGGCCVSLLSLFFLHRTLNSTVSFEWVGFVMLGAVFLSSSIGCILRDALKCCWFLSIVKYFIFTNAIDKRQNIWTSKQPPNTRMVRNWIKLNLKY